MPEEKIRKIPHGTLITHGREDVFIPLNNAYALESLLPAAQTHVFSQYGHWIQIEKCDAFHHLLQAFFAGSLD